MKIKTWLNYHGEEITRSYLCKETKTHVHHVGSAGRYFSNKMTLNPLRNSKYIKALEIIDSSSLEKNLCKLLKI